MAKITIAGDAVVITSTASLEDIKTLEKYSAKALKLFELDEDDVKEEVFRVASGDKGSLNNYGATFNSTARDGSGMATITMCIPSDVHDAKEWVADRFGAGLMLLNKVEGQLSGALDAVRAEKAAVMESITTLG